MVVIFKLVLIEIFFSVIQYYFASVVNSRRDHMLYDDHTDSAQGLMRRDFGNKFPI